jgi:hypothetical protein
LLHYSEASSSRQLARGIPSLPSNTKIVCYECFPCGLPFYLKENLTLVSKDGDELSSNYVIFTLKKEKVWPETVVPSEQWTNWSTAQGKAFYVLADRRSHHALDSIAQEKNVTLQEIAPGWWGALFTPGVN